MGEPPTGTVTLLFTDIEGLTRLLQQVGERYADVLETSRHFLRSAFQRYHSHEVDTQGDSFFVAFTRASDALRAAVDAQRSLASQEWPKGITVRVRMGVHTGEPQPNAEGYVGLDVHRAARHQPTDRQHASNLHLQQAWRRHPHGRLPLCRGPATHLTHMFPFTHN